MRRRFPSAFAGQEGTYDEVASPVYDVQVPVKGILLQPDPEVAAISHSVFRLVALREGGDKGRTLALRAADATKEIRVLIGDSRKSVATGAELVGKTSVSLGALIKGAGSAAAIVTQISSKMQGQTTGLGSLRESMRVLETTARTGAQVANQSQDLGMNLRQEATAMIAAITAFRGGRRAPAAMRAA